MKIEKFKHTGVKPDGTFKRKRGAVAVHGRIVMDRTEAYISISLPRTQDGIVKGICVQFDDEAEMDIFFKREYMSL